MELHARRFEVCPLALEQPPHVSLKNASQTSWFLMVLVRTQERRFRSESVGVLSRHHLASKGKSIPSASGARILNTCKEGMCKEFMKAEDTRRLAEYALPRKLSYVSTRTLLRTFESDSPGVIVY